jgi:copper resistance protein B
MKRTLLLSAAMLLPSAAYAQQDHSAHQGHDMPAEQTKAEAPPVATDPHAGHDMGNMEEVPAEPADPHAGHDMSAMPADDSAESDVGDASAPAAPGDHAADAVFGAEVMAQSRKELAYEVGGMGYSLVMLDLAEVGFQKGRETYRFEGEAFTGGNINRFGVKFEGEGAFGGRLDDLELQALYSRAIAPYWNLQAGVRHDIKPDPSRTYLVAGVEGIAPYWFKVNAATFLSNKGELRARVEASYDQRITQSLILQPRLEANVSFQDIPAIGVGSGLTDFEAGLRLRYEIKQEIAPYIGVEWRKQTGATARFSRIAGEDPDTVSLVAGIRIWF